MWDPLFCLVNGLASGGRDLAVKVKTICFKKFIFVYNFILVFPMYVIMSHNLPLVPHPQIVELPRSTVSKSLYRWNHCYRRLIGLARCLVLQSCLWLSFGLGEFGWFVRQMWWSLHINCCVHFKSGLLIFLVSFIIRKPYGVYSFDSIRFAFVLLTGWGMLDQQSYYLGSLPILFCLQLILWGQFPNFIQIFCSARKCVYSISCTILLPCFSTWVLYL